MNKHTESTEQTNKNKKKILFITRVHNVPLHIIIDEEKH